MHLKAALHVAVREDLHLRVGTHQSLRGERLGRDLAVDRVLAEAPHVHADVRVPEARVLEAAHLRDAHVDRRLAALEPAWESRTASGQLTLRSLARGLALAGGDAAAHAAPGLPGTVRRAQFVLSHLDSSMSAVFGFASGSFTWTRCATRRSMPRTAC